MLDGKELLKHVKGNLPTILILTSIVGLIAAALLYLYDEGLASEALGYAFFLLVVGVLWQFADMLRG